MPTTFMQSAGVATRADGIRVQVIVVPRGNTRVTAVTTTGSRQVPVTDGLAMVRDIGLLRVGYRDANGRPAMIP